MVLCGCGLLQKFDLISAMGPVPSPFDCYLVNRGLKTLAVRMERHQKNAIAVAKFLEKSPMVEKVKYPGLPSHPQFEIMKKQVNDWNIFLITVFFIR